MRLAPTTTEPEASAISLSGQILEGLRWLRGNRGLKALTWCIVIMNVTFMTAFAIRVLNAQNRLGLDSAGFGLLLTTGAVGGLTGSLIYPRLEQRLGHVTLVRAGLVIEAGTHLVLALTQSAAVAYVTMALFGVHAVVWGAVAVTVRQRATPDRLQGRVTSVYLLGSRGGAAVGSVTGGLIGQGFGLTAPFWIAATGGSSSRSSSGGR